MNVDCTPAEQPAAIASSRRSLSIGLPKGNSNAERRFPLTPEAVEMLTARGYSVKIQHDAASTIHYSDMAYIRCGVTIAERGETLRCDIVIHLAPLTIAEIKQMRRGAMLLTLLHPERQSREVINALLDRNIIAIAIDLIKDEKGNTPFADILSEVDGRAAIALASSLLADASHGKGILLGGVSGITPCEAVVIGSGISARATARSAAGLGALVRMFDNDVYRLRSAAQEFGANLVTSVLHPRVFLNALRTADVVIATDLSSLHTIDSDLVEQMKQGVVIFDLNHDNGVTFPSLPIIDASSLNDPKRQSPASRVCYINAGNAVPRTATMALSNTFITLFEQIASCDGVNNSLKLLPGMQHAVFTFMGKVVNARIAHAAGLRHFDISLFLSFS